jgi:hemoglobin-like flavoprotein
VEVPEEYVELFNDSLDRCNANPAFMDVFYDAFIGGSPEVAAMFAATPMKRQKRLLKASLFTAMLAADDNGPAKEQLRRLAVRHEHLDIRSDLFDFWLESLIAAAKKCGGELDVRTEAAWRAVLGIAIEFVKGEGQTALLPRPRPKPGKAE